MSLNGGKGRRRPAVPGKALVWVAAAVVVLVVVDVVLVAVALNRTRAADHGQPAPVPTFSSVPSPAPAGSGASSPTAPMPSSSPSPAASRPDGVTSTRRFLSPVTASVVWRATAGACTGADAVVERSTDGGRTWETVATGRYGVHTVAGLDAGTVETSVVAGTGVACAETALSSFTDGRFWATDSAAAATDYVTSDSRVHLTSGSTPAPCAAPTQVLAVGTTTAVVCSGVLAVQEAGADWVPVPVAGLVTATTSGDALTLVRTGRSTCRGLEIDRLAVSAAVATSAPTRVGCASAASTSGPVAIGRTGTTVFLWSGDQVLRSADGGATW